MNFFIIAMQDRRKQFMIAIAIAVAVGVAVAVGLSIAVAHADHSGGSSRTNHAYCIVAKPAERDGVLGERLGNRCTAPTVIHYCGRDVAQGEQYACNADGEPFDDSITIPKTKDPFSNYRPSVFIPLRNMNWAACAVGDTGITVSSGSYCIR